MTSTPVVYSPRYEVDLGLHVFPTAKYRLVRDELERRKRTLPPFRVVEPAPASWDELALVHTSEYLEKIRTGNLARDEMAQLELPWSADMVDGFRTMVGGTILAARLATARGSGSPDEQPVNLLAIHIGGGLHHAFPGHGEGFCPFNDVAVAVRVLQAEGTTRHAIIDLDVHHGNGTAFIFNYGGAPPPPTTRSHRSARAYPEQDAGPAPPPPTTRLHDTARAYSERDAAAGDVFTFSMHQQHNYPMWKPQGSLDIGLPDGVHDATYLRELERALPLVLAHQPECVFYLAGADPYEDDQLGGLRLTTAGLRARDRLVIRAVRDAGVPLVVVLAGGYARHVEDTVAIHVATIEEALAAVDR